MNSLIKMKPRILLVNPPIFDFSAYDFWFKPYGMLRVAGFLRGQVHFEIFDFLDRHDSRVPPGRYRSDRWGRGEYFSMPVEKPEIYAEIPRQFRRFGLPRKEFRRYLGNTEPFDFAFLQTGMTYWYLGLREVSADLRASWPSTKIILGGVYATICAAHARTLGADFVLEGTDLSPLWKFVCMAPEESSTPLWELYPQLSTGVLKLADGCPFRCTYCSVPKVYPKFDARPLERSLAELDATHAVTRVYLSALYADEQVKVTQEAMTNLKVVHDAAKTLVDAGSKNVFKDDLDRIA